MRKATTSQGAEQVLRYRNVVTIQDIQPIAPKEFESFKKNETPLFSWNSVDGQEYRLAFSTDPTFEKNNRIFRIPDQDWLREKSYQPDVGEWNIIWLLSRNLKKEVYWMVEARSDQNEVSKGIPQRILLK